MNFIALTEVDNQTLVIIPRFSGQVLRLGALRVVTTAGVPARVYGSGVVEVSQGYWDMCTIVEGEYAGPPFNGYYSLDPDLIPRPLPNGESVLETQRARSYVGHRSIVGFTERGGSPSLRIFPISNNNASRVSVFVPEALRSGGQIAGSRELRGPLQGSVHPNWNGLRVSNPVVEQHSENYGGTEELRVSFAELTSEFIASWGHGGARGSGDVTWSRLGLFEQSYEGPVFDGDSGWVLIDGVWMHTRWNPDGTSTASMPDDAVSMTVERSIDDGTTWSLVLTDETGVVQVADHEALSNGVTIYRVTTYAATGAATVREYPVSADSEAVWLNGGVGFGTACRLPYDPTYSTSPERERGIWQLAGNTRVAWAGQQAGETVTVGGRLLEGDEDGADHKELGNLFLDPEPLHMVRTPNGTRIHGVLSNPDLSRTPGVGIWQFGFTVTEADRG